MIFVNLQRMLIKDKLPNCYTDFGVGFRAYEHIKNKLTEADLKALEKVNFDIFKAEISIHCLFQILAAQERK